MWDFIIISARAFVKSVLLLALLIFSSAFVAFSVKMKFSNFENIVSFNDLSQDLEWRKEALLMVKDQIMRRGVSDKRVLEAISNTPRHKFVPAKYRFDAYSDGPLPIGEGQTISQPYIVALMTELLQLKGGEKVLEIGTGSGYQAAVLSPLVKQVYTIELIQSLADNSKAVLEKLGYKNVTVKCGDGYQGWIEHAPFDRIIITAAPDEIPKELVKQLKVGGIMVVPVGTAFQELIIVTKTEKGIIQEKSVGVRFVPMVKPKK